MPTCSPIPRTMRSSYDAMIYGSDEQAVQQSLTQALQTIEQLAPDPQGLGNRRILISEYGLFENEPRETHGVRTLFSPPPKTPESTELSCGTCTTTSANRTDNTCRLPAGRGMRNAQRMRSAAALGSFVRMGLPARCSTQSRNIGRRLGAVIGECLGCLLWLR